MFLFNCLFEASILLALLFLLYYIFLKSNTFHQLNRLYLLSSLLLCIIIPFIELPKTVIQQSFTYSLPVIEINESVNQGTATNNFGWLHFLQAAYLFITASFIISLLFKYIKLFVETKNIHFKKYQDCKVHVGKPGSPAFSFFKYIFIPSVKDEQEREVLLQHEMAHAKALHSIDILLVELFKCLIWFHPVIYLLRNELTAQHEFAIDRHLTRTNFSVQQYGKFLINQTQIPPAFSSITNFFNKSLIKNRIKMMTTTKSKKQILLNYVTTLTLAVVACIFLVACEQEDSKTKVAIAKAVEKEQKSLEQKNTNLSETEKIHAIVEEMPSFPGGDDALLEFLYTNIKYPEEAKDKDIQGLAIVEFIVEKDGSISNVKILRSIGGGTDEETLRVIGLMPKWTPGKDNGQTVRVEYKLPVRFKLTDDSAE